MPKIAEKNVLVRASLMTVWEAIYEVECWQKWNPMIQQVALLETPKAEAIGCIYTNKAHSYPFKITKVIPGSVFEWQREYELGTVLKHIYSVTKNAEGSIFTTELFCTGNMAKIVTGIMQSRFKHDLEEQVLGFQRFCERLQTRGQMVSGANEASGGVIR